MVVEEPNFIDLACLLKISTETQLEKFGSQINASFFDASNIAGTLKQKGLIDFSSTYPGPNVILVTEAGKNYINEANIKAEDAVDMLDDSILNQLSAGKRMPFEVGITLNIRSKDLAMRIYKLSKQGLLVYELRNGNAEIMLTEAGFLRVRKEATPGPGMNAPQAPPPEAPKTQLIFVKGGMGKNILILLELIVIIGLVAFLYTKGLI